MIKCASQDGKVLYIKHLQYQDYDHPHAIFERGSVVPTNIKSEVQGPALRAGNQCNGQLWSLLPYYTMRIPPKPKTAVFRQRHATGQCKEHMPLLAILLYSRSFINLLTNYRCYAQTQSIKQSRPGLLTSTRTLRQVAHLGAHTSHGKQTTDGGAIDRDASE